KRTHRLACRASRRQVPPEVLLVIDRQARRRARTESRDLTSIPGGECRFATERVDGRPFRRRPQRLARAQLAGRRKWSAATNPVAQAGWQTRQQDREIRSL